MKEGVGDPHKANTFLSSISNQQHGLFVGVMCKGMRRKWEYQCSRWRQTQRHLAGLLLQMKKPRLRGASHAQDHAVFL